MRIEQGRVINRSSSYVLPMLDHWERGFIINQQFAGCFIGDTDYPQYDNHIFLLYRFTAAPWYLNFEQIIKQSEYFVKMYEPDKFHTMFILDVPAHQQINLDIYKQSKYSKLSESLKRRIMDFYGKDSKILEPVLYKHESKYLEWEKEINKDLPYERWTRIPRDLEATSALDLKEEIYNDSHKIKSALEENKEFLY